MDRTVEEAKFIPPKILRSGRKRRIQGPNSEESPPHYTQIPSVSAVAVTVPIPPYTTNTSYQFGSVVATEDEDDELQYPEALVPVKVELICRTYCSCRPLVTSLVIFHGTW
jgi:hypothetical protein